MQQRSKETGELMVEIMESGLVSPCEKTPNNTIWLSNIDISLAYAEHQPTIYVYRPNGDANFFKIDILRASLSRVLAPFYPLAGRLVTGPDGRLEIDCTGEGVLFVVARSKSSIDELGDFAPSPKIRKLLVPSVSTEAPAMLLAIQVTFFKSGEVVLGTGFHHIAADGCGMSNFIKSWADMARGVPHLAIPPFLDRTLLLARSPPVVRYDHVEYKPNARPCLAAPPATAVLELTQTQVALLKNNNTMSTFQAVGAHLWRCACIARRLAPDEETWLYFPVNARARLDPPLPDGYFGNVIFRTSAVAKADEIVSNSLGYVGGRIRDATARVSDEYVRSVIDFFEMGKNEALPKLPKTDLALVSWLRFSFCDADFGWGKPEHVGMASLPVGGFVYIINGSGNDGGICIVLAFETENLERFRHVFYDELDLIGIV